MAEVERQNDAGETASAPEAVTAAHAPARGRAASGRLRLLKWAAIAVVAAAVLTGSGVLALLYADIESSPFVGRLVRDRLVASLQERIDPSLRVSIESVDIRRDAHQTIVDVRDFRVRDIASRSLIHAPSGRITLATAPLIGMRIVPTGITLSGLRAEVEVAANGAIVVTGGEDGGAQVIDADSAEAGQPLDRLRRIIGGAFAAIASIRESVGGRLPEIGIEGASIRVHDRRVDRRFAVDGLRSRMQTFPDGSAQAQITFLTEKSPIAVDLRLSSQEQGRQRFVAESADIRLGELLDRFGLAGVVDLKARASIRLETEIDPSSRARSARADIAFGPAILDLDRKMAPVPVEKALVRLSWTDGREQVAVDEVSGVSDGSVVALVGVAEPPREAGGAWRIRLGDAGSRIAPMTARDTPIAFDRLEAELSLAPDQRALAIDALNVAVGGGRAVLSGRVHLDDRMLPGLDLNLDVEQADARVGLRLWPAFAATSVRDWLAVHVAGGRVDRLALRMAFPPDVLADAVADRPIPATALAWSFSGGQGVLLPLPGMPYVRNLAARGQGDGRTAAVDASSGVVELAAGKRLSLGDIHFSVADVSRKPADGRLRAKVSGSVESALELIRAPGIRPHVPAGLEKVQARGLVEGDLAIDIPLSPKTRPADARIGLTARLRNLTIDQGVGGEKIEAGEFTLGVDGDAFSLKGDARLHGAPAQIEVKGTGKGPAVAQVSLTLDDAARARKGIQLGPAVAGPAQVRFVTKLDGENEDVTLDVDLTRVAINAALPGVSKKAGAPGRLRAVATELDSGGWSLEKMEFDAGGLSARGSVVFAENGEVQKAQLSQLRISPGDAMQVDAERAGGLLKVNVRGNSIDARPFLRSVLTGGIDKSGGKDLDLTLRSTVLSGFNGELLANADVRLGLRGGGLHRFELGGRFDGGAVAARLQPAAGNAALTVTSEDAGAFFRYFDLYNRMRGGRLELTARLGRGTQGGDIAVRNFVLRDEPAMKRLVADASTQSSGDTARLQADLARQLRNGQDVSFTRMTLAFARTPGRMDIREGVLIGPEIGGNINGKLDYARDSVDLTGTFVPAFSLNNMVANVPLVGPLLAGGRNEGLFAVRYAITGKASAPTLSVNPLTAIAPGFFRKLIDFRGMGGTAPAPRHEQ